MLNFLFFLLLLTRGKEFFPTLLVERYKNEFSIDQFDHFYPEKPESIQNLRRACENDGNESCLKLGIKILYSVRNISGEEKYKSVVEIFERCALKNNNHCMDFLTQLHFFHSNQLDYNIFVAQNSLSNTVFARLLRANLEKNTKSCSASFSDIASIAKAAFIEFISEPLHCIKRPDWFDEYLETSKTIESRLQALDRTLEKEKFPRSLDPSFHCTLLFDKGRELFLSFLNSEKAQYFDERSAYKFILENNRYHNPTYFSELVQKIPPATNTTNFTNVLLTVIQLFQLVNNSRRIDVTPKLKRLADSGDPFASAVILFASKMRIEPFRDTYSTKNYSYNTISPLSEFINGLSYELGIGQPISCEEAYSAYINFIYQSQVFYDVFDALQAVEDHDYLLALLIYERLALMGKKDAIHNIKMILKRFSGDLTRINLLQEKFKIPDIDVNNIIIQTELNDLGLPQNKTIDAVTLLMYAYKAEDLNEMNEYLNILVKLHPFARVIKYPCRLLFELTVTYRKTIMRMFASRKDFLLIIFTGIAYYYIAKIVYFHVR